MRRLSGYGPSLIVLTTAIIVLLAGPHAVRELTHARTQAHIQQASLRLSQSKILDELNQAYRDIATMVEPSVVHISASRAVRMSRRGLPSTALSSGSGWIWDDDGHIVTNHHVVEDAESIEVQLHDGSLRRAELVGADPSTDIAVIKVDPGRLIAAQRASELEDDVEQGQIVFAFGSPFDFRFSMSQGVVSGSGRSVGVINPTPGSRGSGYENFIQVDAAINPGNSGGPLTNHRGEVIGMNTAIATRRENGSADEGQFAGIGLAIPMNMIHPVVSQLVETGRVEKGFLGVNARSISNPTDTPRERAYAARLIQDLTDDGLAGRGVYVSTVTPDSPAFLVGVREGDVVIAIDNDPIGSIEQLRAVVSSKFPGDQITLKIWRPLTESEDAEILDLTVTLARLDSIRVNGYIPDDHPRDALREFGIAHMETANKSVAARFNMEMVRGVVITELVKGSKLKLKHRIPAGTTITTISGREIVDIDSLFEAFSMIDLKRLERGERILVHCILPNGEFHSFGLNFEDQ